MSASDIKVQLLDLAEEGENDEEQNTQPPLTTGSSQQCYLALTNLGMGVTKNESSKPATKKEKAAAAGKQKGKKSSSAAAGQAAPSGPTVKARA